MMTLLLSIALACACGRDTPAATDPGKTDLATVAASIQVSGAPSGPTFVGSAVQLVAAPLNATGAAVSN